MTEKTRKVNDRIGIVNQYKQLQQLLSSVIRLSDFYSVRIDNCSKYFQGKWSQEKEDYYDKLRWPKVTREDGDIEYESDGEYFYRDHIYLCK